MAEFSTLAPVQSWELAARLGTALLVGAILGYEREVHDKPAGLRTYTLVSLGAAFFVLIPIQLDISRQNAGAFGRVVSGIITGVGFIGGGMILQRSRDRTQQKAVKGLTSAAAMWVTAALGTAAGCGLWQLALLGAVIALVILRGFSWLERYPNS